MDSDLRIALSIYLVLGVLVSTALFRDIKVSDNEDARCIAGLFSIAIFTWPAILLICFGFWLAEKVDRYIKRGDWE